MSYGSNKIDNPDTTRVSPIQVVTEDDERSNQNNDTEETEGNLSNVAVIDTRSEWNTSRSATVSLASFPFRCPSDDRFDYETCHHFRYDRVIEILEEAIALVENDDGDVDTMSRPSTPPQ